MKQKNSKISNFFSSLFKGKKENEKTIEKKIVIKNRDTPLYIGFSELKREYRKSIIKPGKTIKCLIGFPLTGKTRFIAETFKNLPEDCVFLNVSLSECTTYRYMWEKIIRQVKQQVRIEDEDINKSIENVLNYTEEKFKVQTNPFLDSVESVFGYLTKIGRKIILILDQFESARTLFENNESYYSTLKNIASDSGNIDCSLVLVTKAPLKNVLRETKGQSSPFEHRFTENTNFVTGFSDDDLNLFFNSISSKQKLSEKQIREILYYTGNNPALLTEFKRVLQKYRQKQGGFEGVKIKDVITPELRTKIRDFYEKFYKYICGYYYEDIISKKGEFNYLPQLIPYIYNFSRNSKDEHELTDLGLLKKDENGYYYCISHGFTQYIIREHTSEFDSYSSLSALDNNLYKLFMIELENLISEFRVYGESILDIEREIIQKSCVGYEWENVETYYNRNSISVYHDLPDYFKILSCPGKLKFLKEKWNIFGKYFKDSEEWRVLANWDKNFCNIIKNERDGVSHFNIPFMKPDVLLKTNECCKQICEIIASKVNDMPKMKTESEYVSLASHYYVAQTETEIAETKDSDKKEVDSRLSGEIVEKKSTKMEIHFFA